MPIILQEHILPALSWTLVHSLWQGVLIAGLAAIIIILTRKLSAALRYNLLCSLLFLFITGIIFSFCWEWNASFRPFNSIPFTSTSSPDLFNGQLLSQIDLLLQTHSKWIASGWMVIVFLKLVRLFMDVFYLKRLRTNRIQLPDNFWLEKIRELAKKTGIKKDISLLESTLVKVPMVVGHLKPLILIPAGILTHLSHDELESVFLHELAHIRRHDYMVNLLQRLTELVFFFNPGILWLSALIRVERENCCDDVAIFHTRNKITFVEALLRCKQYSMKTPGYALGFLGSKNLLLKRMTRIASGHNGSLQNKEVFFFALNIVLAVFLFFQFGNSRQQHVRNADYFQQADTILTMPMVTSFEPTKSVAIIPVLHPEDSKSKKRQTKLKPQQPSNLNLVEQENKNQLTILINTSNDLPDASEELERKKISENFDRDREQALKDREQAAKDREQAARDREQADNDRAQADLDRLQAAKDRLIAEKDRQRADRERLNLTQIRK